MKYDNTFDNLRANLKSAGHDLLSVFGRIVFEETMPVRGQGEEEEREGDDLFLEKRGETYDCDSLLCNTHFWNDPRCVV